MARLNEIANEMARLIRGITIANGYAYDFGTVNQPDLNQCAFPCANITFTKESPSSDKKAAQYGHCEAEFVIRVRVKLNETPDVPPHEADVSYDQVISDLKTIFGIVNHSLALSFFPVMTYKGFVKNPSKTGDLFTPGSIDATWLVQYQFAEQG